MGRLAIYITLLSAAVIAFYSPKLQIFSSALSNRPIQPPIAQPNFNDLSNLTEPIRIRLLILRHTPEQMAISDARLATEAVENAAGKGLNIKVIGNHLIQNIDRNFISQQMKIDAAPGDTFIIHTIGHGSSTGYLQSIGERHVVMKELAAAAQENEQETIWWQLSCYACAGLPKISELPIEQHNFFSVLASSDDKHLSSTVVQARIMGKLFIAMADEIKNIDSDNNEIITTQELQAFLDTVDNDRRGRLFFAATPTEVIFGPLFLWYKIPILDAQNRQLQYPDRYLPIPTVFDMIVENQ